ncbi:unnamed protein product [Schistosoma haematobium]|nr:unnamed protein product [Schistosoma haematobium]
MFLLTNIVITFIILLNSSISLIKCEQTVTITGAGKYQTKDIYISKCMKIEDPIETTIAIENTTEFITTALTTNTEDSNAENSVAGNKMTILYIVLGIFILALISTIVCCILYRKNRENSKEHA